MKRALALVPLALLLVVATGCGAKDTLDLDPVANAASKTTEAGSSRVTYEMTLSGGGQKLSFDATGIFAYDELRGSMTMDMSSLPGAGVGKFEVRMVGSMMYVRGSELFSGADALPAGKEWASFDIDKSLDAAGLGGLDMSQLDQDPVQTLRLLRASSARVTKAGTARVRGVETTRYKATLDLEQALAATVGELELDEQQRKGLRAAAEDLRKQTGLTSVPVEVFVDGDGLLRRYTMTMATPIEGEQVKMTMTTDYFDFGVDVDVKAPPADAVFDMTDEITSAGG